MINNPITVIVADDEAAIRNGLEEIVSAIPYETRVLSTPDNGKDALEEILRYQPDIAIMDINMPQISGLDVIRKCREQKLDTLFFILSGYAEFTYAQSAIRYGVKSYFLKPLNLMEFKSEFGRQCREILVRRNAGSDLAEQNLSSLVDSSRILFLNQMISNKVLSATEIQSKLAMLRLTISSEPSCVVIFQFKSTSPSEGLDLAKILKLYMDDSLNVFPREIWTYHETQIIAIFNIQDPSDASFRSMLEACAHKIQENIPCKILIGIGNTVPSLMHCAVSYAQAQEALTYHIYQPKQVLFDTSLISDAKPTFSKENIDFKPIVYGITHCDTEGIRSYCSSFFQSLFFITMPPPNFIIGMCMYMIVNVQKQINLLYPDKKIEFEFTYDEISAFESVTVLEEWLTDFFIRYSEMLRDSKEDDNSIIRTAKKYIKENLSHNIKTKEVAAQVNLSESYFSIYFKDKTGVNFRDYVLKARIDSAKAMLQSKQVSISEIAYETGYQDYRSFSRAFKNETGMSPSEYSNHFDDLAR